jgi:hypothetical protein
MAILASESYFNTDLRGWLTAHLGALGTILFFLALCSYYVWSNWGDLAKRPGVPWILKRLTGLLNNRPRPSAITVAIALFEGDDASSSMQRLVREELSEMGCINIVLLKDLVHGKGDEAAKEKSCRFPGERCEAA